MPHRSYYTFIIQWPQIQATLFSISDVRFLQFSLKCKRVRGFRWTEQNWISLMHCRNKPISRRLFDLQAFPINGTHVANVDGQEISSNSERQRNEKGRLLRANRGIIFIITTVSARVVVHKKILRGARDWNWGTVVQCSPRH